MDDEFQDLEAELRALRPTRVSRELWERVGRELNERQTARAATKRRGERTEERRDAAWLPWLALPIAAAVALALALPHPAGENPAAKKSAVAEPVPGFKPVAAQNILVSSRDEGDVTLADGTRARRVRQSYVDTITWRNPRTKASLTWSVPREEVRVTPVSYE